MLEKLRKRMYATKREEGFTLIELMIVVVIIAILLAIAIPALLGARARAQEASCKENMSAIATGMEGYYAKNKVYTAVIGDLVAAQMLNSEPKEPVDQSAYTIALTGTQAYVISCANHTFTVTTGGAKVGF